MLFPTLNLADFVIPSGARDLEFAAKCRSLAPLGMTIYEGIARAPLLTFAPRDDQPAAHEIAVHSLRSSVSEILDYANIRKIAIALRVVQAVADHVGSGNGKADVMRLDRLLPAGWLIEQSGDA